MRYKARLFFELILISHGFCACYDLFMYLKEYDEMHEPDPPAPYGQGDEEDIECDALERIIRHSSVSRKPKKAP